MICIAMRTTSEAGTVYYSGALVFTFGFSGVRVVQSLVFRVVFGSPLFVFCSFSFDHCIVCHSI
jgi:hypothetical protein